MANIELPKDAEGREIPLDTTVMFGGNGNTYDIVRWSYITELNAGDKNAKSWYAVTKGRTVLDPELMYLTPPDSWEKLEEDLSRASGYDIVSPNCRYFTAGKCVDCRMRNGATCSIRKNERAFADILDRIRKLRGED